MSGKRLLRVESLECRRVLAASLGWDGPGQGSAELTYHIGQAPAGMSQAEVNAAIETALDAWSDVVDVDFTPAGQPGLRDSLDFSFQSLDGPGGTLAQAYFPDDINPARIAGDIQFDVSDRWEIGNGSGGRAFDLVSVAVHEIGHALGLDHSHEGESVLFPSISSHETFAGLSEHDVEAILRLYAPATTSGTNTSGTNTGETPAEENIDVALRDEPTERERPQRRETPWNRWRWSFEFSGSPFDGFRGFGRMGVNIELAHNFNLPTDVNADLSTTPIDALLVINSINGNRPIEDLEFDCDTNADGVLSAMDALLVINELNYPESDNSSGSMTDDSDDVADEDGVTDELDETLDPEVSDPMDVSEETEEADTEEDNESELDNNETEPVIDLDPESERELDELADPLGEMDDEPMDDADHGDCPEPIFVGIGLPLTRPGRLLDRMIDSAFESFDEDGSGSLTESEVPPFVWNYLSERGVDSDGNGEITLAEIQAEIDAERLERFQHIDANDDGVWSESEIGERRWQRLQNADTNGDQGISFDELQAYRELTPFQRVDANGDGQITQDEVSERRWERLITLDQNDDNAITEDELPTRPDWSARISRITDMAARAFRMFRRLR